MLSFDKYYNSLILESDNEEYKELLTKILNANTVEEAESLIATDVVLAYRYSRYVLKGKFEKGEKTIATVYHYSYWYALDILNDRFELGEKAIATDKHYSKFYINFLKLKNIPIPEIFKDK